MDTEPIEGHIQIIANRFADLQKENHRLQGLLNEANTIIADNIVESGVLKLRIKDLEHDAIQRDNEIGYLRRQLETAKKELTDALAHNARQADTIENLMAKLAQQEQDVENCIFLGKSVDYWRELEHQTTQRYAGTAWESVDIWKRWYKDLEKKYTDLKSKYDTLFDWLIRQEFNRNKMNNG